MKKSNDQNLVESCQSHVSMRNCKQSKRIGQSGHTQYNKKITEKK